MGEVVQIGDFLLSRKRESHVPYSGDKECLHRQLELDDRGDVCRCIKCGIQVSAFWALTMLAADYGRERDNLTAKQARLAEETSQSIHLLAARKVEKAWRSRSMVPCCPHCGRGIRATDGLGGSCINTRIDDVQRKRAALAKEKTP
jgi:hypothetical protein